MSQFEKQYREVRDLLAFKDYPLVLKRIIDFTLDTQSLSYYHKTSALLNRLDRVLPDEEKHAAFEALLDELYHVLAAMPEKQAEPILTAQQVGKSYSASSFALGPVTLQLIEGQIIGLVGENGNGKTTLLRLLCGELHSTSGSLTYHFHYKDLYDLRTRLVYIPQRTETWRGSMYENLVFTASTYGYSAEENELVVQLVIARLGLRKYRQHQWKDLSSGYKMRFELARMLLRKPKLLLIDEPLANLDILAQQTILEDFRAIAKSPFRPIGVILSSQQLYEVEKTSDQVIFLKNGAQKNLRDENNVTDEPVLVIEFESSWSQSQLHEAFTAKGLESLSFNGGTYVATFRAGISDTDFLRLILDAGIPISYFRNISNSTRRFFIS